MRSGKIVRCFSAEDGREVVLRIPKWEDSDDLLEFTNSHIEERADVLRNGKV